MADGRRRSDRLREMLSTVGAAVRLSWSASPSVFRTTVLLAGAAAVLPPAIVWLSKHLVDLVVEGSAGGRVSIRDLVPTIVALGALAAALRALNTIQLHRQTYFASLVEAHAERRLLGKIAVADLAFFDRPDWHDRAARATRDLSWRPYTLAYTVVAVISSSVTVAGMLVLLSSLSPILATLALLAVLPPAVLQLRVNRDIHDFWTETTTEDRYRTYLRDLLSKAESAKEVRAYAMSTALLARHERVASRRLSAMRGLHRRADRSIVLSAALSGISLALSYALVAGRGLTGDFTPGDFTVLIGAFASVSSLTAALLGSLFQLQQNAAFLADYFSFLGLSPLLPVAVTPIPLPEGLEDGIRFEAVTFTYPGTDAPAVADINLHIRPGELLALVGANAAGKTTLVKLMLRFYDPQQGTVRVGDVDVREANPDELRRRMGVLFQDFARLELTVRDNVSLGIPEGDADDEAVLRALKEASADDIVSRLSAGLDSHVGRLFEGGHELSGGEWQRLALARVLFRGADIWILDEPTASLDAEVEAMLFANLRRLLRHRIGIVISHRFSTVRVADRIAVLSGGRITETGTHEELMALGGTYAHLFELQAAGYR